MDFLQKWFAHLRISTAGTSIELTDGSLSNLEKRQYLPNFWLEKVFKGTIAICAWGVTWNYASY